MESLKELLFNDQDINKPIQIMRSGRPTDKFLIWNIKQINEGKINYYADQTKIYNKKTKSVIKADIDLRYKKIIYKESFLKKLFLRYPDTKLINNVLVSIPFEQDIVINITDNAELEKPRLLIELIQANQLNGEWRIIIIIKDLIIDQIVSDRVEKFQNKFYDYWWATNANFYRLNSEYFKWQNIDPKKSTFMMVKDKTGELKKIVDNAVFYPATFIFSKNITLEKRYIEQKYLDGISHCFFTPILNWAIESMENTNGKSVKKRYQSIINKIVGKELKNEKKEGYLQKYKDGIPESDIQLVCDDLQICIEIEQPFKKEAFLKCESQIKPLKTFKLLNTRLNHLEYNQSNISTLFTNDYKNKIILSRNELIDLQKKFINEKVFFIFKKDHDGISCIKTLDTQYMLSNEFFDTIKQFEYDNGLHVTKIDALKYPKLQQFINNGVHWNGTTDFIDVSNVNVADTMHIDETKAYTQFNNCKYYDGFLGKITDFRKVNNYDQKGYYYITDLDTSKCSEKFIYYNENLSWFKNNNIYTDPELRFLKDENATFKVVCGAYGLKIDFSFTDDMINKKDVIISGEIEHKIPYYSKWVGLCGMINDTKNIYMNGPKEYFELIKDNSQDTEYNFTNWNNEARISYKKKTIFNNRHIAGQITAYQRLNLMDQLLKMDHTKIIRVCVDGIYYFEHEHSLRNTFSKKEKKTFANSACEAYLSNILDNNNKEYKLCDEAEEKPFYMKELFTGIGGSGKTHNNLKDNGLINVCYIAPSWKLASAKKNEYDNIEVNVLYRILTQPYSTELCNKYSVYIFDECSQYTNYQKKQIFKTVKGKIIFCGDLGYQLPPVIDDGLIQLSKKTNNTDYITEMNKEGFDNYQHFDKSFRCKCNILGDMSIYLRQLIDNNINDFDDTIKNNLNITKIHHDNLLNKYKVQDMILASEHDINNIYDDIFDHLEKYKITQNTRDYNNGEIVYKNISNIQSKKQHGYTIHSIQGETFTENIYIDFDKFKSIRMLYTAISRARYESQLYEIIH